MKLKFLNCLLEPNDEINNQVACVTFSPNGKKLAIATSDRHILLFDNKMQRRDKFSTKPIDAKFGKKNYTIKCLVFSPDSTKLAVGQTDDIVYVYRLGELWDEKKVICNKFLHSASVSALLWPEENRMIIGVMDGKVRSGSTNSNKCSTLYKTDAMIVALSQHPNRRSFVSGHVNGSIIVYSFESRTQTKICVHSAAPYCLVLSNFGILAAGADRRIVSYNAENGKILQDFDYSTDSSSGNNNDLYDNTKINSNNALIEKEFFVAVSDASGQNVIFASFDRFRLMTWNQRRGAWSEGGTLTLRNFHTATALAWKPDGTTVIAGNTNGAVITIDCCMKRALLKNRFETTYVSPSQIVVTDTKPDAGANNLKNLASKCVIRSNKNYAITDLRVLGGHNNQNHYIVGHTAYTMILTDLQNDLCSEIAWDWSGNERFYLENENVCMIVNAGEVSFVEYGSDNVLGWIRTERVNPHLISVRVSSGAGVGGIGNMSVRSEQSARGIKRRVLAAHALTHVTNGGNFRGGDVCRVAYLLDIHTISIVNLVNNLQIANISHTNSIDWIELNESGNKLLFRDVGSSVYLYNIETESTSNLLNYCSYVQWVPQSNVIVAQSGDSFCVWYNCDDLTPASLTLNSTTSDAVAKHNAICFPIQGDIESVVRDENHTEVFVVENNTRVAYELDNAMIEFGTALNNLDLSRALIFLERSELAQRQFQLNGNGGDDANGPNIYELAPMWQRLGVVALENMELLIAQRCFSALNDFPKVRYLQETIEKAELSLQQNHIKGQYVDGEGAYLTADYSSPAAIANHFEVRARIALLNKNFKTAERIYLENNALSEAIEMYKKLSNWQAAIELAKAMNYVGLDNLKESYFRNLNETGQQEKAAEIKFDEGDLNAALQLYLESNRPAMAARIMIENAPHLLKNEQLVKNVIEILTKHELFDKVGELLEETKRFNEAIEAFRKSKNFGKAINIARFACPEEVVKLEEEWGNALFDDGNFESAINHFLESGKSIKAADCAIRAKEWTKAIEILNVLSDSLVDQTSDADFKGTPLSHFYAEVARHYEAEGEYEKAEKFYLDGNLPTDAIEMYNKATYWAKAYELAAKFLGVEESRKLYSKKAESLEQDGKFLEAEKLYISIGEINRAISMYKEANRLDEIMRLVERYHTDQVPDMHKRLAKELEKKGDLKGAEEHYLSYGDYDSAVEMYKEAEQWSDAYRVAKFEDNDRATKQVAYLWAKNLSGDAAVKLLTRHNCLQDIIDMGINKNDFDFIFDLCNYGAKSRLVDVQQKFAEHLEDEGDFVKAEEFYLKAGKGQEAVLMHIHNHNWDLAESIANLQSADMLNEVFVARARAALEAKRLPEAESYLLRADRADIILAYYQKMGSWTEALQIAGKYLPHLLEEVQNNYEEAQLRSGAKGAQLFVVQGAEWERQGEYRRAVDCYLKVDETSTDDLKMIAHAQTKAGELIVKFLRDSDVVSGNKTFGTAEKLEEISARLMHLQQFYAAGEVFLMADMPERAVVAFVEAKEWTRVQRIAAELSSEMVEYVENKYRDFLRAQGRVNELIDVDVVSAIDLLAERHQWDAALSTAKQQNHRPLLDKYLIMYVSDLISKNKFLDAVKIFIKFGASTNSQNFNVYKKLIDQLVNDRDCDYETFALLRNMLLDLNTNLALVNEKVDQRIIEVFERYQYVLHFYALHKALEPLVVQTKENASTDKNSDNFLAQNFKTVQTLRLKQMIAMLRYVDLLQPDKVFYEAGNACREYSKEYENLGFVLLNHFLDIVDAIEESDSSHVDNSIFVGTDVPQSFSIPSAVFLTTNEYDEVRDWVLATSVSQNIVKELKVDEYKRRPNCYEASTIDLDGKTYPVCVISGYPIIDSAKDLGSNKMVDANIWTNFTNILNNHQSDNLYDVQQFLNKWTTK